MVVEARLGHSTSDSARTYLTYLTTYLTYLILLKNLTLETIFHELQQQLMRYQVRSQVRWRILLHQVRVLCQRTLVNPVLRHIFLVRELNEFTSFCEDRTSARWILIRTMHRIMYAEDRS